MIRLSLVLTFFLSTCSLHAQIKYGLKAGVNFYQVIGKNADAFEENQRTKIGPAAGLFINLPLNEIFSIQPELLYSFEGNFRRLNSGNKETLNLSYVNIPVIFQYQVSGFSAESGPQIGILAAAKSTRMQGDIKIKTDYKDFLKEFNLSWAIGLGFKTPQGFGAGIRYNIGLSNISDSGGSFRSGGFHVGVFYVFQNR